MKFQTNIIFNGEIDIKPNKMTFYIVKGNGNRIAHASILYEPNKKQVINNRLKYQDKYTLVMSRKPVMSSDNLDIVINFLKKDSPFVIPKKAIEAYKANCSIAALADL